MNFAKKTLKYLDYLQSQIPEYPTCCRNCDYYEDGDCCDGYNSFSEQWCPYKIYNPENFSGLYQFDIESRYEPQFKDWKRVPDSLYRRLRRNYIRYKKKMKKADKKKVNKYGT